jgi:hypothetical protein
VAVLLPTVPALGRWGLSLYLLYLLMIFLEGSIRNRSIVVGVVGVFASIVQLTAYAHGMVEEFFSRSPQSKVDGR